MRRLIVLLAAASSLAGAQEAGLDSGVPGEQPLRRYTVEIIIFEYRDDASAGSEIFLPDEPTRADLLRLDEDGRPNPGDEAVPEFADTARATDDSGRSWRVVTQLPQAGTGPAGPFLFTPLPAADFTLDGVASRFDLLDAYKTIAHFGWTQFAFGEEETPAIELELLAQPPSGLAGTLTLYLSRYLHLVVDLALDAPDQYATEVVENDSFYSFGDQRGQLDDDYARPQRAMPVRFRIREDRIVKNGEIRYFDHPKFGVLAKVTRVEENGENPVGDGPGA